jgi:hypothetical protein
LEKREKFGEKQREQVKTHTLKNHGIRYTGKIREKKEGG